MRYAPGRPHACKRLRRKHTRAWCGTYCVLHHAPPSSIPSHLPCVWQTGAHLDPPSHLAAAVAVLAMYKPQVRLGSDLGAACCLAGSSPFGIAPCALPHQLCAQQRSTPTTGCAPSAAACLNTRAPIPASPATLCARTALGRRFGNPAHVTPQGPARALPCTQRPKALALAQTRCNYGLPRCGEKPPAARAPACPALARPMATTCFRFGLCPRHSAQADGCQMLPAPPKAAPKPVATHAARIRHCGTPEDE